MLIAPLVVSAISVILATRPDTAAGPKLWLLAAAAVTVFATWRCARTASRRLLAVVLALLALQAALALVGAPPGPWPSHRMLRVMVLIGTGATLLTAGVVFARLLRPALALTAAGALAIALVFAEAASGLLLHAPDPELEFELTREATGASVTPRDTTVDDFFTEDPERYLDPVDLRSRIWSLSTQPGNEAELVLPPDRPGEVRVAISRADPEPTWHIQLSQSLLPVEPGREYTLQFQYRAGRPRPFGVGFVQAHPPWHMVGFYRVLSATSEWQDFVQRFTVEEADSNTRISIDLAGSDASLTVRNVMLTDDLTEPVEPPLPAERFYVRYRFDAVGCRDGGTGAGDSLTPRILVIGGSGVLGRDVHQRHTLASQLEAPDSALRATVPSLARGIGRVINCAMRGADVEVAARALPAQMEHHRPSVVMLGFARDDLRRLEMHEAREWLRTAPTLCRVLTLCARALMPKGGAMDAVLPAVSELVTTLQDTVRARGAEFRVFLMQTDHDPEWDVLAAALREALRGDETVVTSVRPALADSLAAEVLLVPGTDRPNALAHRLTAAHLAPLLTRTTSP
jgi:hypothetical protein